MSDEQKVFSLLILTVFLSSCMYFTSNIKKAEKALKKKDCSGALKFFHLSQKKPIKFAYKASKLCTHKSPREAVRFYAYLSRTAKNPTEKLRFKKQEARIYFERLQNYDKAVEAYSALKNLSTSLKKKEDYIFKIAQAYFEMGKWSMSLKELKTLSENPKNQIKILFLKARIFLMQEKLNLAEQTFREIQSKAPGFFKKTDMFLYLSFIYESRKEFKQAISELENFKNTGAFLRDKLQDLNRKQQNLPRILQ